MTATENLHSADSAHRRFEALYREHFRFVWASVRSFGIPCTAAEDVVQDVFATAYRRLDSLAWDVSPRGWLFTVVRRTAFRHRRSLARSIRRREALSHVPRENADEVEAREAARELERLIMGVPGDQRRIWWMSELLGMSGPEISAHLGVPLATCYSRLRLARQRLHALARASQQLPELVEDAQREFLPPRGAENRVWLALVPTLGQTGALATALKFVAARPVATALLLAGVVAGTVAGALPERRGFASTSTIAPAETAPPSARWPEEFRDPARTFESVAPPSTATAMPPPPTQMRPPKQVPAARSPLAAPSIAATPADDLAAQMALLDEAKSALARGDLTTATDRLERHRRKYADSPLADARDALRIRVLCKRGDLDTASALLEDATRAHPGSLPLRAARESCAPP